MHYLCNYYNCILFGTSQNHHQSSQHGPMHKQTGDNVLTRVWWWSNNIPARFRKINIHNCWNICAETPLPIIFPSQTVNCRTVEISSKAMLNILTTPVILLDFKEYHFVTSKSWPPSMFSRHFIPLILSNPRKTR